MFGLGLFEILLILAGILVFIRPQDLPAFVYRVGKIYGQIKEAYTKFWREANLIKNQIDEMVEKETSEQQNKEDSDTVKPINQEKNNTTDNTKQKSPVATAVLETVARENPIMADKKTAKVVSKKTSVKISNTKLKKNPMLKKYLPVL